ncbi:MAG: alkaline phosphatase family protein, partial [Acidimicrobiales bacterium]
MSELISRRQLLCAGLAASGLFLVGQPSAGTAGGRLAQLAAAGLRGPGSLPNPQLPPGTDTLPEIEHILVLMMENHSYDNYLGMLGRGPGLTPRGDGFSLGPDGLPTATNPYSNGSLQRAFHMPTTCQLSGQPDQEWVTCHDCYDGGKNDGFVTSPSGPVSMGYWTGKDIPFAYSMAGTFPLADRWFSSLLGQTFPNRRYLLAATSEGMVDDDAVELAIPALSGTVMGMLDQHGISWRNYYSSFPPSTYVWLLDAVLNNSSVVPIAQFFADAASGNLPGFAVIDPDFSNTSEENPQDIAKGEAFAASVVNAVMSSPAWPKTLLLWT